MEVDKIFMPLGVWLIPIDTLGIPMNLDLLGWSDDLALSFAPFAAQQFQVGRVARQHKQLYTLYTEVGELAAEISGKFRYQIQSTEDLPCVGDWVVISAAGQTATIQHLLPRRTLFSRKVAGGTTEVQLIAANLDSVFLVCGLDHDFNVRRIERYLVMIWESGARPIIILNKVDIGEQIEQRLFDLETIALGIPMVQISALHNQGLDELSPWLQPGKPLP